MAFLTSWRTVRLARSSGPPTLELWLVLAVISLITTDTDATKRAKISGKVANATSCPLSKNGIMSRSEFKNVTRRFVLTYTHIALNSLVLINVY
jgi:hypothetical protein